MSIRLALTSIAVLVYPAIAMGQDVSENQNVPLREPAVSALEGNWVAIREQSEEAIDLAVKAYCQTEMFSSGESPFKWDFDENTYATVGTVLGEAKGTLAFRFNGPDDLFIAHIPKPMFGGEIGVSRAVELRMDLNGESIGVTYGPMTEKSPDVSELEAVQWLRYSIIIQSMVNHSTGEAFYLASYPRGPNYEDLKATEMFVKCPNAS